MSESLVHHRQRLQAAQRRCQNLPMGEQSPLHGSELRRRLDEHAVLSVLESSIVADYAQLLEHWKSYLVMTDRDGVLLRSWGQSELIPDTARPLFSPGQPWSESALGCNAIGICLHDQLPTFVSGKQHSLHALRDLECSAAPLVDPRGDVDGCLAMFVDPRRVRSRTQGFVQVLAQQLENRRLIDAYGDGHYQLTFNNSPDNLDSPRAGLLIIDSAGQLQAMNARARWILGEHIPARLHWHQLCGTPWREARAHVEGRLDITFHGRLLCHARLSPPRRPQDQRAALHPAWRALDLGDSKLHHAILLAERLKDAGIPMLIQGETGVGKEVFVRALHAASQRADMPLVAINCAAIPSELVEAELFGYERGAFTGADPRGKIGRIRQAHGGRLFLDEIGDMPLGVQARLLRVLQERQVTPLGATDAYAVDIELVAATHRPLEEQVAEGRFRADLYYRLCGVSLPLPPVREREDLRQLVMSLLSDLATPLPPPRLSDALWSRIQSHAWPGNIRELENLLRVGMAIADGNMLDIDHLPALSATQRASLPPSVTRTAPSADSMSERLARHNGNVSSLARELGVSRTTLYKWLRDAEKRHASVVDDQATQGWPDQGIT
ncbi:sigma-54-dependent Fis family transcriptional regulator [Litchfieldella rifensis]|uniref:Sigma-54-dependent Fis family transcriptional regulator n=1 Tax=Litchfieldella rifensis TaxID=762643 RepID=A0ABV7LL80_9GAMM